MDAATFRQLLERPESDTLDFKRTVYDFAGSDREEVKRARARFVKDVVCMFNTPRDQNAHIVLGVEKTLDGKYVVHGVAHHPDDADLQGRCAGLVHPHPVFTYEPVNFEGKQCAVITVPLDRSLGPCVPVQDVGDILRRHMVYHRRSSRNSEADAAEQRRVYEWFKEALSEHADLSTGDATWDEFIDAVHGFRSTSHQYLLCISALSARPEYPIGNLASVDWGLVVDLAPDTDVAGALSSCAGGIRRRCPRSR